jgi:hypothetical protein
MLIPLAIASLINEIVDSCEATQSDRQHPPSLARGSAYTHLSLPIQIERDFLQHVFGDILRRDDIRCVT